MKIEVPKTIAAKNALLQTLILVIVYIVINLLVYGFNTFRLERNIIVMAVSICVMALFFFLFKFRYSILSIELNESNVIIRKVNNSRRTLDWNKINAIGIKNIASGNKHIHLPGYLFSHSGQNEEYLNYIEKKLYEESTGCLKCGNTIPEGSKVCESCGWSYEK